MPTYQGRRTTTQGFIHEHKWATEDQQETKNTQTKDQNQDKTGHWSNAENRKEYDNKKQPLVSSIVTETKDSLF